MSAPAISGPDPTVGATAERVSTREVREAAFRALRAAGASAGEAAAAATTVLEAEIQGWGGLSALLHEIATIPTDAPGPVSISHHALSIVDDPSRRGPLLLGRPVFDLAAAQAMEAMPVRMFVRGFAHHRVLLCLALELAERTRAMTVLVEVDRGGTTTCAVACTCDGRVLAPDENAVLDHEIPWPPRSDPAASCGGLQVTDGPHAEPATERWHVLSTPRERTLHHADALRHGIYVPLDTWASVNRASRRFLVPEHHDALTEQG